MRVFLAIVFSLAILLAGAWFVLAMARSRPREEVTPEDVAELDVYLVCGDCGTELKVEKIGQLQIPRHCGEPMQVERRPRGLSPN